LKLIVFFYYLGSLFWNNEWLVNIDLLVILGKMRLLLLLITLRVSKWIHERLKWHRISGIIIIIVIILGLWLRILNFGEQRCYYWIKFVFFLGFFDNYSLIFFFFFFLNFNFIFFINFLLIKFSLFFNIKRTFWNFLKLPRWWFL